MFEFVMTEPMAAGYGERATAAYTARRLARLAAIAETLAEAEWPIHLTMTGLAFSPPVGEADGEDPDGAVWEVAEMIAELGVEEPFLPFAGRRVGELCGCLSEWMWGEEEVDPAPADTAE